MPVHPAKHSAQAIIRDFRNALPPVPAVQNGDPSLTAPMAVTTENARIIRILGFPPAHLTVPLSFTASRILWTVILPKVRTSFPNIPLENSYIFKVDEPGTIIVGVTEKNGKDTDVQILSSLKASACLARGDKYAMKRVNSGIYYVTVDSFNGAASAGPYTLAVQFLPDSGKCGLTPTTINRYNTPATINLPTIGNVVLEAHLVTVNDRKRHNNSTTWWPSSFTDEIDLHREHTRSLYPNYIKKQTEPWCPSGEGGCSYGQGSAVNAVPDDAEAWYICMYWKNKPKVGTRFLVLNPFTGKAVVAAAGYESGPGDGDKIGGAVDEVHDYLGTRNSSPRSLLFSQMTDSNQTLPFGPIECKYPN